MYHTHLHDNADCRALQQQLGDDGGIGYSRVDSNSNNGNRRRHGGGFNTDQANTIVTINGTSLPTIIAPAPAAPVTALPTSITFQVAPTPYVTESPSSSTVYSFLAGSATPGPPIFAMTSDCGASSHFIDSNLIGDIEPQMKDIVKLDPPATIVVGGHSTLRGVSVGTLTGRVTDVQGFLRNMSLQAMNVPGFGRHLFSGGTAALKWINTFIAKESYLDVDQFKISSRKDTECPKTDYLDH